MSNQSVIVINNYKPGKKMNMSTHPVNWGVCDGRLMVESVGAFSVWRGAEHC